MLKRAPGRGDREALNKEQQKAKAVYSVSFVTLLCQVGDNQDYSNGTFPSQEERNENTSGEVIKTSTGNYQKGRQV